jgi:hypothetical protein|tara:strand:+ start:12580 stop:12849 length:270 start_codon:yes stop_codon:yes gene_type:complete
MVPRKIYNQVFESVKRSIRKTKLKKEKPYIAIRSSTTIRVDVYDIFFFESLPPISEPMASPRRNPAITIAEESSVAPIVAAKKEIRTTS